MSRRTRVQEHTLTERESEFEPLLISCLQQCANGRWGLFGQNDHLDPERHWPEAARLKELAVEIHSIRSKFGLPSVHVERFLHFCSLKGANVPGEPRLARKLLDEFDDLSSGA